MASPQLINHLIAIRTRLVRMAIILFLVFVPAMYFANDLFTFLSKPLLAALPEGGAIVAMGVMSPFTTPFKLAFYVSIAVVMPYLLWELWRLIAPALFRKDKGFAVPLVIASIALFYAGMAFAYFLVFPGIFQFIVATTPHDVQMRTDMNEYVGFALTLFLSFGLSFEVPIVVILLVISGLVSAEKLTASRGYVIIGIVLIAAIITPTTDAVSQLAMAGPMWLLYEGGVIIARVMLKMRGVVKASDEGTG
ncbi:MAG: twin-arginine translocase subunit TatC [Steroidobacteraceae bacterium]